MVTIYFQALCNRHVTFLLCLSPSRLLAIMIICLPGNDGKVSGDSKDDIPNSQNGNRSIGAERPNNSTNKQPTISLSLSLINSSILIIGLLGLVGNGVVIWLLGFRIKRTPYTTYILNLSIADFGVLICLISLAITMFAFILNGGSPVIILLFIILYEIFFFSYSTSQFLLAAIGIDRCVAVLFPLWHQCHRPPYLSTIACALIWILSFLLSGIHLALIMTVTSAHFQYLFQLIVNVLLCAPLMFISTLTLFIKVYCKAKQHQRGKLMTAILLALLFFFIFAFPLNVSYIIYYFCDSDVSFLDLFSFGTVCASLNSSINPLIYFLVGRRQGKSHGRVSIKVALQRVLEVEQACEREQNPQRETPM